MKHVHRSMLFITLVAIAGCNTTTSTPQGKPITPIFEGLGTHTMPVGLFGASTGAAAALVAAANRPLEVQAVVSRGGRPDLAAGRLADVRAPTLLIVGD